MEQQKLELFGIKPLEYSCDEVEHKKFIDAINNNPGNCKKCGRLWPKNVLEHFNNMCNSCYWYTRDLEYLRKMHPDYFQKATQ